jgi:hypothetical protein
MRFTCVCDARETTRDARVSGRVRLEKKFKKKDADGKRLDLRSEKRRRRAREVGIGRAYEP